MMKVLPCDCKSEYQDKKYGKQLRIHNGGNKTSNSWKCTVCGKVKS